MKVRPGEPLWHEDLCPEELRLLRTRDGSREPSALRLAAIRDRAQAEWKAAHDKREQRRRLGTARATLGLTLALACGLFVVVVPAQRSSPVMMAVGAYCPTELATYCGSPSGVGDGVQELGPDAAPCRGFSPPGTSCFEW